MDLSKPKNSRQDTHNDQDDTADYCVDGFARPADSKSLTENDNINIDPRQDVDGNVAAEMSGKHIAIASSSEPSRSHRQSAPNISGTQSGSQVMTMRIPKDIRLTSAQKHRLRSAEQVPPVTKETLSELDLERIIRNIHLRTDANFEPDLHFKPDLDGEKGRKKRKVADNYWEALEIEIAIYLLVNIICKQRSNQEGTEIEILYTCDSDILEPDMFRPRLPIMFETLQDVLKTLVPERDHPGVMQNLDISFLMQQVRKGVLDLVGLSTWLAGLLKTHCAPMRDQVADEMVAKITMGYAHQDMGKVIHGLRTLFGILEMMKLVCKSEGDGYGKSLTDRLGRCKPSDPYISPRPNRGDDSVPSRLFLHTNIDW
jgi:hypothetical protein